MPIVGDAPLILQYLDLLKQWGDPEAPAVVQFLDRHRDDPVLLARARLLRKIYMFEAFVSP